MLFSDLNLNDVNLLLLFLSGNHDFSRCSSQKKIDDMYVVNLYSCIFQSLTSNMARLPVIDVSRKAEELLPKDFDYFPAFLALLEAFNIGFRILDSRNRNA